MISVLFFATCQCYEIGLNRIQIGFTFTMLISVILFSFPHYEFGRFKVSDNSRKFVSRRLVTGGVSPRVGIPSALVVVIGVIVTLQMASKSMYGTMVSLLGDTDFRLLKRRRSRRSH